MMDESAKTELRNYLTAAGFLAISAGFLVSIFKNLGSVQHVGMSGSIEIVLGTVLLIVSTILVVMRKRDMIAAFFIMMALVEYYGAFSPMGMWSLVLVAFLLLMMVVTLTSQYKKKWLLILFPLVWMVYQVARAATGYSGYLLIAVFTILVLICLYFTFCCLLEKASLPGRRLLTEDEETEFKKSGSLLEYMFFTLMAGGYALYYIFGESVLPIDTMAGIEFLCGGFMIYVAVLLIAVGKMRFTPIMFIMAGTATLLGMYTSGMMFVGIGILFALIGIYAMVRKESRFLPGIMFIVYGGSLVFTAYGTGGPLSAPVVSIILNAVPCLIAIYLAFATYSPKKLPVF